MIESYKDYCNEPPEARITRRFVAQVQMLCVDALADIIHSGNISAQAHWASDAIAAAFRVNLRCPGVVAQDDKVVASYPASLWQHVRKTLRLPYREVKVRVKETIMFPQIEIPEEVKQGMRITYAHHTEIGPARVFK